MNLDIKVNGLDEVEALIEQARKQTIELDATTRAIRRALAELGIEISQPEEVVPEA